MLELREQLNQEKQRHHAMRERLDIQEQTSISKEQMHQQVTFLRRISWEGRLRILHGASLGFTRMQELCVLKDRNKATSDKNLALESSITVLQQNCIDLQQQVSKLQGDLDARRRAHESVADISQELLSAKARNALLETQLSDLTLKLSRFNDQQCRDDAAFTLNSAQSQQRRWMSLEGLHDIGVGSDSPVNPRIDPVSPGRIQSYSKERKKEMDAIIRAASAVWGEQAGGEETGSDGQGAGTLQELSRLLLTLTTSRTKFLSDAEALRIHKLNLVQDASGASMPSLGKLRESRSEIVRDA